MQILRKTELKAFKKAKRLGASGIIKILKQKGLVGRGGAAFPTGTKWEFALNTKANEKFVICNADEGEPGTFKDKFIIKYNPEALVEGILIAAYTIKARQAFIYLRGEYSYLENHLKRVVSKVLRKAKSSLKIGIIVGAGAYVCGEETAVIESIEGFRGQPYYKPPYPPTQGLYGEPTIINNVETFANVPQAILFNDWDKELRLYSLSGNLTNPGIYELPVGYSLAELIGLGKPKNKIKAVYFGCFGGCIPYSDIKLTPENVCGKNCAVGAFTIIAVDEKQSILDIAENIAKFYEHESCGKCTPCREGTKRICDIIRKIKSGKAGKDDLADLKELAENIQETSLCGLGQTATNHLLTALQYFKKEFEERIK